MKSSREARLGVLAVVALALLPAALAVWIHDGREARASGLVSSARRPPVAPAPASSPAAHVDLHPDAIAKDVEALRGLDFPKLPPVEIVSPARVQAMQKRQAARVKQKLNGKGDKLKKLRDQSAAAVEFLKLAGVVEPSFSAQQTVKSLLGSVAGEFDPSSRKVKVLVTSGEGPEQRATVIAHELDHSLDNAHFPDAFRLAKSPNSEQQLAASALIEGTATVVAASFDAEHGYQAAVAGGPLLSAQNAGYGVPPVLAAQFRFPYTSGARFVKTLYERAGGWRLVNRAFRHPPATTAQILNPGLWIHHVEAAHVRIDAALAAPLHLTERSSSGQLDAELILALALPAPTARTASQGWDGGSLAVWQRSGGGHCASPCRADNAAVLADRWRTVSAAAGFLAQLPTYLRARVDARPEGPGVFSTGDGYAAIALQGQGTAMAFAPSAAQAQRIAEGAAQNANEAR